MTASQITYATARNWAFTALGMGYGLAQRAARIASRVETLVAQIGIPADAEVVVRYEGHGEGYDESYGDYREYQIDTTSTKTLAVVLTGLVSDAFDASDRWNDGREPTECGDGYEWGQITDLTQVGYALSSTDDDGMTTVYTVDGWEAAKRDERRKGLESTAAAFAAKCGHAVASREFVKAAKAAIRDLRDSQERWDSDECRMERMAACLHAGCRDSYFADNDYVGGQYAGEFDRLGGVLEYMRDNFPLLMLHIDAEGDEDEG